MNSCDGPEIRIENSLGPLRCMLCNVLFSMLARFVVQIMVRVRLEVWTVAYSPDGSYLVSGSHDNTATGVCLHTLAKHTKFISQVSFSPDGSYIVSASDDGHNDHDLERGHGRIHPDPDGPH